MASRPACCMVPRHSDSPDALRTPNSFKQMGLPAPSIARSPMIARPVIEVWRAVHDRGSTDRDPVAFGIAAGRPASDLRLPVDINRVGVLAARHGIALIGRTRNHRAIAARIFVAPTDRSARRTGIERPHLRLVGARPILVVERGPHPVADQSADGGARHRAHDAAAAAAELRSEHRAAEGAHEGAGALVRAGWLWIARTGGQ